MSMRSVSLPRSACGQISCAQGHADTAAEHANSRLENLRTLAAFEVATLSSHYIAAATQRKPRYLAQTTAELAPERASGKRPCPNDTKAATLGNASWRPVSPVRWLRSKVSLTQVYPRRMGSQAKHGQQVT